MKIELGKKQNQKLYNVVDPPSIANNPVSATFLSLNPFFKQVYDVVEQIPCGRVASYGQIARMLGRPRAARVVGWAMRCCPERLPWQRVVMGDGSITGGMYANIRKGLLEAEGITFLMDGRVDMKSCSWPD